MPAPAILRPPRSRRLELRGLAHHLTEWDGDDGPALRVLLHGFMDCGATFQFLVDAFDDGVACLAPDWRGFGLTAHDPGGYWFPEYFADLDALLDEVSPIRPVDLVGHSMGGNVALMYAGLRPERVRRVVSLEGFGLADAPPSLAPERYRKWLDQVREPEPATIFPSLAVLADVLRRRNPRLTAERAIIVATAWAEELPDGRAQLRWDPAHRRVNPVLYRRAEAEACWAQVRGPVLCVAGTESDFAQRLPGGLDGLREVMSQLETSVVAGAGHMLHHDQPDAVAQVIGAFLAA